MPLTGNRLGAKDKYQYQSDVGSTYILRIDPDLVITNSGLVQGILGTTHPIGWKPRRVFAQLVEAGKLYRKTLIAGAPDATLYATNTPQVITLDGAAFTTTGRAGEVQSFI